MTPKQAWPQASHQLNPALYTQTVDRRYSARRLNWFSSSERGLLNKFRCTSLPKNVHYECVRHLQIKRYWSSARIGMWRLWNTMSRQVPVRYCSAVKWTNGSRQERSGYLERKFQGTNCPGTNGPWRERSAGFIVLGNKSSRELTVQGTNGPENESSIMGTNVSGNEQS